MREVLEAAISWTTLPYTVLMGLVCLYWIIVILGIIDLEAFDFAGHVDVDLDAHADFDAHADVHADAHADAHAHAHSDGGHHSIMGSIAHIFCLADVPIMIPISLFSLSMWVVAVLSNYYLNPNGTFLIAFAIFGVNLVVSAIIMRIVAKPFAFFFKKLAEGQDHQVVIVGSVCTLISNVTEHKVGQAEVLTGESPILLNVMKKDGPDLVKGTEAAVVEYDENKDVYIVKALNL